MSWHRLGILVGLGLAGAALATTSLAHEPTKTTELPNDPMAACVDMKQGAGVTEEGHGAMREFMDGISGMMGGQGGTMPHQPGK